MADDIIEAGVGSDVDESRPKVPSVPWLANSVVEEGFVRRTRALLRTAPLHRLADVLGWQAFDSNPYDPRVLCLAAIDAVIAQLPK